MKIFFQLFLLTLIILFPLIVTGQDEIIITGKITDNSGKPLIDANATIVDESFGSSSDQNGEYNFKLPAEFLDREVILEIQYVGYISQVKKVKLKPGENVYYFEMEKDVLSMKPIVVTAQRRKENLQDVPTSITAMSGEEINRRGIDRVFNLQHSIPNFYHGDGAFDRRAFTSIRGIAGASRAPGVEKRAAYYIDDVYVGRSIAVNQDLFDLERIEVLKGPQGTLFGKNTVSGAINITANKPVNQWEGAISVEGGNLNYLNTQIVLNVPLIENKLFTRFCGKMKFRDGFVRNVYFDKDMNEENTLYGRFQLRYLPIPNLDINLSIDALRDRRDRTWAIVLNGPGHDLAPGPREVAYDLPEYEHRDIFGTSLSATYHFPNQYSLKSITALRTVKNWSNRDEDFSPYPWYVGFDTSQDVHFTQEFRLISPLIDNFYFVTGLFYFYQKSDQIFGTNGSPDAIPYSNLYILSYGPVKTQSIAGYFHLNYHLNNSFSLFGGLRYTYEYKTLNWSQFSDSDIGSDLINLENYRDTYSKGVFSPQLGLQYKPWDQLMIYGKTTWGYKSGGFGNHTVESIDQIKLDPEYVISYESGVKLSTFNNRLSLNMALFLCHFDNFQAEVWEKTVYAGIESFAPVYTNAAKVSTKGIEMELITTPLKNLSLAASCGYADARYDEFFHAADLDHDFTGNKVELAPEFEYSLSIEYRQPIVSFGFFSLRADYIQKDSHYFDASNTPEFQMPAYDLINMNIGFESINGNFGVNLWVRNLTDNLYLLTRTILFDSIKYAWYGLPRTYGIKVTYRFLGT